MKRIYMLTALILILTTSVLIVGCWDLNIIENVSFIFSLGIDVNDEGYFELTATAPVFVEEAKERVEILSTTTSTLGLALPQLEKVSGRIIRGDKMQAIVIGYDVAQKYDIVELLDVFFRRVFENKTSFLLVSKTKAKDVLTLKMKDKPRIGIYLPNLIRTAERTGNTVSTELFNFRQFYYNSGYDPVIPLIQVQKGSVKLIGLGAFKGGKMVGELNERETPLFLILKEMGFPQIYVKYKGNNIGFILETVNTNIKPRIIGGSLMFEVKVNIQGTINEVYNQQLELDKEEVINDIEQNINYQLKEGILQVIQKLQEMGSDAVGFGKIIRSSFRYSDYWKNINWEEEYPRVNFNVEVKSQIQRTGALKK